MEENTGLIEKLDEMHREIIKKYRKKILLWILITFLPFITGIFLLLVGNFYLIPNGLITRQHIDFAAYQPVTMTEIWLIFYLSQIITAFTAVRFIQNYSWSNQGSDSNRSYGHRPGRQIIPGKKTQREVPRTPNNLPQPPGNYFCVIGPGGTPERAAVHPAAGPPEPAGLQVGHRQIPETEREHAGGPGMNCQTCILTKPADKCEKDCDNCCYHTPEIPHPCCICLRHESEAMERGTNLEKSLKAEVELYNKIIHVGPLDNYTPQGYKRLVQVHAIASRLAYKLIQKKTLIKTEDEALHERITHYTTLYDSVMNFNTAEDHDATEDVLTQTHQILHQLMIFFNNHFGLNYNLEPQPTTKSGPSPDEQLEAIQQTLKDGGKPKPC
jgi:hypothetical protein